MADGGSAAAENAADGVPPGTWHALREQATEVMRRAYVPYSGYPVGAAALVDDGRTVAGCNVENAAYGVTLCAECGLVSDLVRTGGGRLVAFACVDGAGEPLVPCGRCRRSALGARRPGAPARHAARHHPDVRRPARRVRARPPQGGPPVTEAFDAVDVIRTKRDRGRLSPAQIDWVVDAYTRGVVAEEQMAALAMAIFLNGMDRAEIARWTTAMIASGERMDFSGLARPTADKHSTGGVGDKITLPLAPLVAVFGVAVPQAVRPGPGPHRRHAGQGSRRSRGGGRR